MLASVLRTSLWAATLAAACVLSACGSASTNSSQPAGRAAGSVTVLMGTPPDSLDPQLGASSQSAEATWISYTGLLTYQHAEGQAGTQLIPGLASALPVISADGKTYTFKLRPGLLYSDGQRVRASDFTFAIERALKLNWPPKSFLTSNIVGAAAFDKGQAKTISGISANDATGMIVIRLTAPFGPFADVLAFPAAALVPQTTPLTNQQYSPPPGVGPYTITRVVPNRSFTLVRNARFAALKLPGIPAGHLARIKVVVNSNNVAEANQVLADKADAFDAADTIPPSLVSQIQAQASRRYTQQTAPSIYYFFLNTKTRPFNNPLAREAVNYAVDKRALQRLAAGALTPACFFLPDGIVGHPASGCPWGDPASAPNLAKAQQLVTQAGLTGTPVTVWGEQRSPNREFTNYYTSVLNQIGFRATPRIIADATYLQTVGNAKTNAQTGYANWIEDFPNPTDFYQLLDAHSIQPSGNLNLGLVNDPHIQSELAKLNKVPITQLGSAAGEWQALDEYVAKQAYAVVFGEQAFPKFLSDRIDFRSAIFHPTYLDDWTSWRLK